MNFKLTMKQEDGDRVWRTQAASVEDGIEQFELAVLVGEATKPERLEEQGYNIEIGWAADNDRWD